MLSQVLVKVSTDTEGQCHTTVELRHNLCTLYSHSRSIAIMVDRSLTRVVEAGHLNKHDKVAYPRGDACLSQGVHLKIS